MKRTLALILALVMLVLTASALAACGKKEENPTTAPSETASAADSTEEAPSGDDAAEPTENAEVTEPAAPAVPADIEIVKEDFYMYSDSKYYFIVVKNNGSETVKLTCNADAKNADTGEVIYSDDDKIYAIGAGQTSIFRLYFSEAPEDSEIVYTIEKAETSKKDVLEFLTVEGSFEMKDNKATITATMKNEGEIPAFHADARVLCYKEGKLVNDTIIYFQDDKGELQPGESMTKEEDVHAAEKRVFDAIEIYITGEGAYGY